MKRAAEEPVPSPAAKQSKADGSAERTSCSETDQESSGSEGPAPSKPADSSDFVGWVDTEIAGHKFHCAARGKYRRHADKRYYCCAEALEASEVCAEGGTLSLRRNPYNPYDSNAVEVLGADGCLLGHLPRDMASRLAPLLDSGRVWVKGDGFAVGRGGFGDPFTLLVHADEAWLQARPPGDRLAAQWERFRSCLETEAPPEGEDCGGCFRFPRC